MKKTLLLLVLLSFSNMANALGGEYWTAYWCEGGVGATPAEACYNSGCDTPGVSSLNFGSTNREQCTLNGAFHGIYTDIAYCAEGMEFSSDSGTCVVPPPPCDFDVNPFSGACGDHCESQSVLDISGGSHTWPESFPGGVCNLSGHCAEGESVYGLPSGEPLCINDEPAEPNCLNPAYHNGGQTCIEDWDQCTDNGGTVGYYAAPGEDSKQVCLPSSQTVGCPAGQLPYFDGTNSTCQPFTDNADGTNDVPGSTNGETCDPSTASGCGNAGDNGASSGSGGSGGTGPTEACLAGTGGVECSYDQCAKLGADDPECQACVASPLGLGCHGVCYGDHVSDGAACISCSDRANINRPECSAAGTGGANDDAGYFVKGGKGCSVEPKCQGDAILCATHYQLWKARCDSKPEEIKQDPLQDFKTDSGKATDTFFDDILGMFGEIDGDEVTAANGDFPSILEGMVPTGQTCGVSLYTLPNGQNVMLECQRMIEVKAILAWYLGIMTGIYILQLAFKPLEAK